MPKIQTPHLSHAYLDTGPPNQTPDTPVLLLLHGWPDDATTWSQITPSLNAAGFRTITPTHRGFGDTTFLPPSPISSSSTSSSTPKTGNTAILALDTIALLDALGISTFSVAGHDWGSNVAEMLAAGWPERVGRLAMLSTPPRLGGVPGPPLWHARLQWYHWFMATARGARAVRDDGKAFARVMWETWSPPGPWFTDAIFNAVAKSFENPDWADVTIHSYRSRWGETEPDPRSKWLDDLVKETKTLGVPTVYFQGAVDGVNPPAASEKVGEKFSGPFERVVLEGVGHFPTREAPGVVAEGLLRFFKGE